MQGEEQISNNKEDLETPQWIFDSQNDILNFDLDVCANDYNAKCKLYFTEKEDGLKQKWFGRCWCHPPLGRKIGRWVRKAANSVRLGDCEIVVMLLPAKTETNWFHNYIYHNQDAEITFIEGRIKFVGKKTRASFPSMLVTFKRKDEKDDRT